MIQALRADYACPFPRIRFRLLFPEGSVFGNDTVMFGVSTCCVLRIRSLEPQLERKLVRTIKHTADGEISSQER